MESMHKQILKTMKARISGLQEGARLASEMELCREFGVSRMTINKVIGELAKEGYVNRLRRWGTFVRRKQYPSRLITFLLPCPDSMLLNDYASAVRRHLLSGILRAVRETGMRLETIAVSPTNDPREIDLSCLRHLDENSLVIVSGIWYAKAFETLQSSGARVLLIDEQVAHTCRNEWKYAKNWLLSEMDNTTATCELVHQLYEKGCRRIAVISPYLFKGQPWLTGYLRAIQELGLPELTLNLPAPEAGLSDSDRAFLIDRHCDGVLLFMKHFRLVGDTVNAVLRLPDFIRIGGMFYDAGYNFIREPFPVFHFQHEYLGYDAVMRLLNESEPLLKEYQPSYDFEDGEDKLKGRMALIEQ